MDLDIAQAPLAGHVQRREMLAEGVELITIDGRKLADALAVNPGVEPRVAHGARRELPAHGVAGGDLGEPGHRFGAELVHEHELVLIAAELDGLDLGRTHRGAVVVVREARHQRHARLRA